MRASTVSAVLLLSLLACAGCQTGEIRAVIPISGGATVVVPMGPKGPPIAEADGCRVQLAILKPATEDRQAFYDFAFRMTDKTVPKRVRIEDISDEKPALLVDDTQPKLEDGTWTGKSENITAEDPRMAWILQIPHSYRVYRFVVTKADGREVTLDQVVPYAPFIKEAVRKKWGEKY